MENRRTVQACQMHVVRGKCWPAAVEVLSSSEAQGWQGWELACDHKVQSNVPWLPSGTENTWTHMQPVAIR